MRIAIFSDTWLPQVNGVSKYLEEMQKHMESQGIRYRLFVPATEHESHNTITFKGLPFWLYPELQICRTNQARIRSELDEFQPDAIYLATELFIGAAGLRYARRRDLPVVTTYHTNFPQYLSYYHFGFLKGVAWRYLKWFHSYSIVNFCPSLNTMEQLLLHGIGNVRVLNNGIDCDPFTPAKRSQSVRRYYAPQGQLLLLYVGRIAPEKGLDTLMKAAKLLNKAGLSYKLLIVGDGPARQDLQAKAIANVVFTGFKSGEELRKIFASADIFVFPSVTETFGNVVLEAMASGLPAIVANYGGVTESLRHGHNGLVFTPDDAESMANCILKLAYDSDFSYQLGYNARQFALTRNWDEIFTRFFTLSQQLIDSNRTFSAVGGEQEATSANHWNHMEQL